MRRIVVAATVLADCVQYRASFSEAELNAPAVWAALLR
jgi:hypothetical protein